MSSKPDVDWNAQTDTVDDPRDLWCVLCREYHPPAQVCLSVEDITPE